MTKAPSDLSSRALLPRDLCTRQLGRNVGARGAKPLGCAASGEHIDKADDQSRPARLVTCAQSGTVVAVEILVEQEVVLPVGVLLELLGAPVHWPRPSFTAQKDARESARQLLRNLIERQVLSRAGRTLDLEVIAVELVQVQQRADQQSVDRHPNRAAPVGIAAEHAGIRFGRQV